MFKIGDKVRLKKKVHRDPFFSVDKGEIGTIVNEFSVKMDNLFAGGEEWDNCIQFLDCDEKKDENDMIDSLEKIE